MNKKDWQEGLDKLQAILKDAKDTHEKSKKDMEELEFTISNYIKMIDTFPLDDAQIHDTEGKPQTSEKSD